MPDVLMKLEELKVLVAKKLSSVGVDEIQSERVADALVYADARGTRSHGTMRVEHYCNRIQKGGINLKSRFEFTPVAKAAGSLDIDGGLGHYGVYLAMKEAIAHVKDTGIYAVSVKNSSHCGALSYYAEMAINAGFPCMVMVNTDKFVVPFGSGSAYFGTNPMAFGFPGKNHRILIDLATSEVAYGKILAAREKNEAIPIHWAVDEEGNPTTDPHKVVAVSPMAAHKGTALAIAIEGFTGLFTGAFGPHIVSMYGTDTLDQCRNTMAFILLVDPSIFGGHDNYLLNTDKMFEEIHNLRPSKGLDHVFVPGEQGDARYQKSLEEGCPVYENVLKFLQS
ncbi:MAG: Ldh family oxidoreductase [Brevinema sp.]